MNYFAGFELGVIFTFGTVLFLAVRFRNRLASFFNRFADQPKATSKPSKLVDMAGFSPVQQDVVDALVGQGMRRNLAELAVRECGNGPLAAIAGRSTAWTFDELFRATIAHNGKVSVAQ